MKKQVVVTAAESVTRTVVFSADDDFAEKMRPYGHVTRLAGDRWVMSVSHRYDFKEVVAYMRQFEALPGEDEPTTDDYNRQVAPGADVFALEPTEQVTDAASVS